ncbi:DUF1045 domain-containing protein [Flavimaricola marinus]|uniref:DUF1045 domain-containing protein n=1 Tax=Flavimaricola marinus TaxID=1819565 RepID=UPI0035227CFE
MEENQRLEENRRGEPRHLGGYPNAMTQYRSHMTLTEPLDETQIKPVKAALGRQLEPVTLQSLTVGAVTLCGEGQVGRFWQIQWLCLAERRKRHRS